MRDPKGKKRVGAGHPPRDLIDVYDFVWTTLRPKAQSMIADGLKPAAAEASGDEPAPEPEAAPVEPQTDAPPAAEPLAAEPADESG